MLGQESRIKNQDQATAGRLNSCFQRTVTRVERRVPARVHFGPALLQLSMLRLLRASKASKHLCVHAFAAAAERGPQGRPTCSALLRKKKKDNGSSRACLAEQREKVVAPYEVRAPELGIGALSANDENPLHAKRAGRHQHRREHLRGSTPHRVMRGTPEGVHTTPKL